MNKTVKRSRWAAILAGIALVFGSVSVATPAQADSTLCSGNSFSTCINAGYTAHGYESSYTNAYWNAYPGQNCTNYVGYMLTQNGDSGHGVAMGVAADWDNTISANPGWGYAMNSTPAVGAIAQWEANAGYAGSAGHVAYVESVNSDGSITISEDNYSVGPFTWRKISSGSANWPTRFLHIADTEVGSGPSVELLFYSEVTLDANIRDMAVSGYLGSTIYSGTWSNWDTIVPLEIDGTAGNELLFYSQTGPTSGKGVGAVYQLSGGTGLSTKLYENTTWRGDWTHLVPVDVDGDSRDELLFYSATAGDAKIYDVSASGYLGSTIYSGTWSNWDTIVPFEIDGTVGDELLLYSQTGPNSGKGRGAVYQLSGSTGLSTKLYDDATWRNNWSHLVPIDVDGDSRDELLFYSVASSDSNIRDMLTTGYLGSTIYSGTWSNWDTIVPFEIDGTPGDELLFYGQTGPIAGKGVGAVYQLSGSTGLSTKLYEDSTWRNNWSHLVPIDVDGP